MPEAVKTVNVGHVPGKIFEVPFKKGWTAQDYLEHIEVKNVNGLDIQIDGSAGKLNAVVSSGATVLAVGKVKGN